MSSWIFILIVATATFVVTLAVRLHELRHNPPLWCDLCQHSHPAQTAHRKGW